MEENNAEHSQGFFGFFLGFFFLVTCSEWLAKNLKDVGSILARSFSSSSLGSGHNRQFDYSASLIHRNVCLHSTDRRTFSSASKSRAGHDILKGSTLSFRVCFSHEDETSCLSVCA